MDRKINKTEHKVLSVLLEIIDGNGFGYLSFADIMKDASLNRIQVKRACRGLAKHGLTRPYNNAATRRRF